MKISNQLNPFNTQSVGLTHELVTDLKDGTDPIEKRLHRTALRILSWLFLPTGTLLTDSVIDHIKTRRIQCKLHHLEQIRKMDPTTQHQVEFQKKIYNDIVAYTERAKRIKLVGALCGLIGHCTAEAFLLQIVLKAFHPMFTPKLQGSALEQAARTISSLSLVAAVVHRYTAGSQQRTEHQKLASENYFI